MDRAKRALQIAGVGAFYLVFIGAFAWGFDAGWMLLAFGWLLFSKLQAVFTASGGAWEAEPYRALAGAAMYFTVMGLARPILAAVYGRRIEKS